MSIGKIKVEWSRTSGKDCLKFTFGRGLSKEQAAEAIHTWQDKFRSKPDEVILLIWDCREMQGYDKDARTIWTTALKELKPQIKGIWLISDSTIVKMGGSVMGLVTGIEVKTVRSEIEIKV